MTNAGLLFMLCSLGFVVGLTAFCYRRILSRPESVDHMHSPLDIDTGDLEED